MRRSKLPYERVTQREIAKLVGVDISTVNKCLKGKYPGKFTSKIVKMVARELGYGKKTR